MRLSSFSLKRPAVPFTPTVSTNTHTLARTRANTHTISGDKASVFHAIRIFQLTLKTLYLSLVPPLSPSPSPSPSLPPSLTPSLLLSLSLSPSLSLPLSLSSSLSSSPLSLSPSASPVFVQLVREPAAARALWLSHD